MTLSRILVSAALLCCVWSCSRAPEGASTPSEESPKAPSVDTKETTRRSTAFGLPLPRRVRHIEERPGYVVVHTDLNIRQLHTFFKENTPPEYELLKTGYKLQLVGLKDFQPEVTAAHIMGQRSPVRLVYRSIRRAPNAQYDELTPEGRSKLEAQKRAALKRNRESRPTRGAPVELRTRSGALLAPGARWFEPYIPPKGSPLDKPHLRSNFGRPFGAWQPG